MANDERPTRRTLIQGLAALATAPIWLQDAIGAEPPQRQLHLYATWHEARRKSQPLLAIVIPETDHGYQGLRGRVIGAALNEADDRLLEALSGYAPVCATALDLHLLGAPPEPGAWFVVIPTDVVPVQAQSIRGPSGSLNWETEWTARIDTTQRLLLQHLDAPAGKSSTERVEHGRATWVTSQLPASHWANTTGCGVHVENREDFMGYACGMGNVPDRAARFLLFLDEEA